MILVDYNQMIIANFMVYRKQYDPDKESDMIRHMVMNNIKMIRNRFCDKYGTDMVFCCDNKGNWRKEYFPLYKANLNFRLGVKSDIDISSDEIDLINNVLSKIN